MRKLRLIAVIVFVTWGGHTLYKYVSDDGKVFVSREKLPESEIVTNVETPVEIVHETNSMDEYFETHKDDVQETIKKSLTDDAIEIKVKEVKPIEKDVDIYKKSVHKPIKHKKFKYCVKIGHKNYTPNELIIRQLRND